MKNPISDEAKKLIAMGILIIALAFCSVYTATKAGTEETFERISQFTASEAEYHQNISELLVAIDQRLEIIDEKNTQSNEELQTTLTDTMDQLTAMNAVFLDYGKRMGIIVQGGQDV